MFAVLSLLSKSFLQAREERTNRPTEQPVMSFLSSDKKYQKADLGAAAPKYPAASRANAGAPRRLIRTRLLNRKNSAFAASKRTAKTEKRSRFGSKDFSVLLGGNLLRFEPRKRGYGVCGVLRGQGPSQAPKFLAPASPILLGWSFKGNGYGERYFCTALMG